jgi:hypothetical protein
VKQRAVAFHRLGRLRDRTAAMLQHRASAHRGDRLVDTVYLGRALRAPAIERGMDQSVEREPGLGMS